jgi:hypothetical protein
LYDGPIGEAYDTFAAVLSDVMNIEGLTMHWYSQDIAGTTAVL